MYKINKKLIVFLVIVTSILSVCFYWLATHSFLELTLPNDNSTYTIELTRDGAKPTSLTAKGSFKKMLRSGNYEIAIVSSNGSYYQQKTLPRFLKTAKVTAQLKPEKSREYVGNNPSSCVYYFESVLFSIACGDKINKLKQHVPASESTPTLVRKISTPLLGTIEGEITNPKTNYLLIKAPSGGEDQGAPHTIYPINSSGVLGVGKPLTQLDASQLYSIESTTTGFLVYSKKNGSVFWFSKNNEFLKQQQVPATQDGKKLLKVLPAKNGLVSFYSNNVVAEVDFSSGQSESHFYTQSTEKGITIVTANKTHTLNLDSNSVGLCSEDIACGLNNQNLELYDLSSGKKIKQFNNVLSYQILNDELLVIKDRYILGYDLSASTGYLSFTSPLSLSICGTKTVSLSYYLLCLINKDGNKETLLINTSKNDTTAIEKRIENIKSNPNIEAVSAYKNFVFITPVIGQLTLQPGVGYTYTKKQLQQAASNFEKAVSDSGIQDKDYTPINVYR